MLRNFTILSPHHILLILSIKGGSRGGKCGTQRRVEKYTERFGRITWRRWVPWIIG
jgi:hypothetical protein